MRPDRRILGVVFAAGLEGRPTIDDVTRRLGWEGAQVRSALARMAEAGYVKLGRHVSLTPRGRRAISVVFIGGGFEVLHRGHFYTIDKAKEKGDVLVVVVARDSTIRKRKKREPVADERSRLKMLSSLRQVDAAILGVEGDIYETLEKVRPDVVALGYDQHHIETEVAKQARKRGMSLRVVRLDSPFPKVKTTALLAEL